MHDYENMLRHTVRHVDRPIANVADRRDTASATGGQIDPRRVTVAEVRKMYACVKKGKAMAEVVFTP